MEKDIIRNEIIEALHNSEFKKETVEIHFYKGWGETWFNASVYQALYVIPKHYGLAEEHCEPEGRRYTYKPEIIPVIVEAHAMLFAEPGRMGTKQSVFWGPSRFCPECMALFLNHKELIIQGIENMDMSPDKGCRSGVDHELENLANFLIKIGLTKSPKVIAALWEKFQQTPRRYLTRDEWQPFLNFLITMEKSVTVEFLLKHYRDIILQEGIEAVLHRIRFAGEPFNLYKGDLEWLNEHLFLATESFEIVEKINWDLAKSSKQ